MDDQQELDCSGDHPLAVEEWLASRVLELIADPRAVCRLALVNKNFCAASVSDTVWQKRLPPPAILNPFLAHANHQYPSKKHLFIDLCKSIDQGLNKFWLDPATGGECYMMSARALSIIWGDTPQYWQWRPYSGSMFSEVACLRQVCWFEVKGTFQTVFQPGRYTVSFRLQLHSTRNDWERAPVNLCVQNVTCAHPPQESQVHLNIPSFKIRPCPSPTMFAISSKQSTSDNEGIAEPSSGTSSERGRRMQHTNGIDHQEHQQAHRPPFFLRRRPFQSSNMENFSEARGDEETSETSEVNESERPNLDSNSKTIWVECDVGEFIVEDDNENRPTEVKFSMMEIRTGMWKGGLLLDGVIIRPSYVIENFDNERNKTLSS